MMIDVKNLKQAEMYFIEQGAVSCARYKNFPGRPQSEQVFFFNADGLEVGHYFTSLWDTCGIFVFSDPRVWGADEKSKLEKIKFLIKID